MNSVCRWYAAKLMVEQEFYSYDNLRRILYHRIWSKDQMGRYFLKFGPRWQNLVRWNRLLWTRFYDKTPIFSHFGTDYANNSLKLKSGPSIKLGLTVSLGTSSIPQNFVSVSFFLLLTPHHYNTQKNDLCSDLRVRRLLTAFITAVLPVSEIPLIEPSKPKSLPWETDLLQLWKVHQFLKVPSTPKWLMPMSTMNQKHQHLRA